MNRPLKLCLILNGPPNSGKDTLADIMVQCGFVKHQFKTVLFKETIDIFRVDPVEFMARVSDRVLKEQPWEALELLGVGWLSPRQALIHTSERVMKPRHGQGYYGHAAAKACIAAGNPYVIFSDGGFEQEVAPLQSAFETTLIVRLHRADTSFSGDSRKYLPDSAGRVYDIYLSEGMQDEGARHLQTLVEQTLLPWGILAAEKNFGSSSILP